MGVTDKHRKSNIYLNKLLFISIFQKNVKVNKDVGVLLVQASCPIPKRYLIKLLNG